jgi:hypothetical protein
MTPIVNRQLAHGRITHLMIFRDVLEETHNTITRERMLYVR